MVVTGYASKKIRSEQCLCGAEWENILNEQQQCLQPMKLIRGRMSSFVSNIAYSSEFQKRV